MDSNIMIISNTRQVVTYSSEANHMQTRQQGQ